MTGWWARHAARAARDRYGAGRALDPPWVTQLEAETVTCVTQTGGDVRAALDDLHEGLTAATRSARHAKRTQETP